MFTDTPKLQPISTSRNIDKKKVPSNSQNDNSSNNNTNNNSSGVSNIASITTASNGRQDSFSNRCSYGSYRGNNYRNQNCPKNYKTREFNDYYSNSSNFTQSNNYNSNKRWTKWANHNSNSSASSNTNYNRWNVNHNNNNNNNKYCHNTYAQQESSFAEDSFIYNSFDKNKSEDNSGTDLSESTTNHTKTFSHKGDVKFKEFRKNKEKQTIQLPTYRKQNTKHKFANDAENTKQTNGFTIKTNAEKTAASRNHSGEDNIENSQTGIEKLPSTNSLLIKKTNFQTKNSATQDKLEKKSEKTVGSSPALETENLTAPQPKVKIKNKSEESPTVLENLNSALVQEDTSTTNNSEANEVGNIDFQTPKISLIPLSRLIAVEFLEAYGSDHETAESLQKHLNTPQKNFYKPNLIERKRNASTCSNSSTNSQIASATDCILEKLFAMNKMSIKNIINSSDTKYDEALKMQARKRLREEIRRQLKSMNIEPPKDPISSDFAPDEIVDAIDIPDVVFDEIRKALDLELFPLSSDDTSKSTEEIVTSASLANSVCAISSSSVEHTSAPALIAPAAPVADASSAIQLSKLLQNASAQIANGKNETKIKKDSMASDNLKEGKTKTIETRKKSKKLTKRKETRKSKRHRAIKKIKEEDIVVVISSSSSSETSSSSASSLSSSSSSSSSSTSSSDSDSDNSSTSTAKRKRLKLKLDAEHVVDSFEKLILSSLSENLRERYRSKYSTSTNTKLHFISCICTSDYNSGKFSKLQIAKVQKNLKSSDCSMALEFLMKEVVNVFNKQKQMAKMDDNNKTYRRSEISPKKESTKDAAAKNAHKDNVAIKEKHNHSNNKTATNMKSVNVAEKFKLAAATNGEKHIQQCVSKVLSLYRQEMKAAIQANEEKNQSSSSSSSSSSASATAEIESTKSQQEQQQQTSTKSTESAGPAKQNEIENENPINCGTTNQSASNLHQTDQQQSKTINQECAGNRKQQQQQACDDTAIEKTSTTSTATTATSTQIIPIHNFCSTNYSSSNYSDALNSNLNSSILGISAESFSQQSSFPIADLEELRKQSPIGEVVINNLREIDVKLMELHKRKMYLEEMILKLQKDKMEADLLTIKLQNEKFILLNTAMTANVTSTAMKNHNSSNENVGSTSKQTENFSSLKNIKLEATKTATRSCAAVKEKTKEPCKENNSKSSASSSTKKSTMGAAKRKVATTTVTATASGESSAKRCKLSKKSTTTTKSCSKRTSSLRSTKSKTSKSLESTAETSSKCESSNTLATAQLENVTETSSSSNLNLAAATGQSPATNEPAPALTQSHSAPSTPAPPTATLETINNNPQVVNKSKSLFKSMPTGSFDGIRNPITQIRIFDKSIVASSEDGKLYQFDITTLKLLKQFSKHTEAITQMHLCLEKKFIYTTSLDGYLKSTSLENLALDVNSVYLQEPLQSIDIQWDIAYVGSRWGNIYTYNVATNSLVEKPLCSTDSSIISIKTAKEGARKILIVSSKGNLLHLRDGTSGLLLRTFDVPESINIYSILLNDGIIYCGTQKKEIRTYDFVSGEYLGLMICGNGAVSMQIYNNKFIFVGCYDGFIYILDKTTKKQVGRLAGSGKMILTLEIIEDKIITSAKDNTMKVTDIPSCCLKNNS